MSERLRPVPLSDLRPLAAGRRWNLDQPIAGLATLTPVRGTIEVVHHGSVLEVRGRAETIVTLCCDRCLEHFNHPLSAEARELLELAVSGPEAAVPALPANGSDAGQLVPEGEDLDDRLDPAGSFDPERWIFEQLCLQMPVVNRCGAACAGPERWSSEAPAGDPRWAALAKLLPG